VLVAEELLEKLKGYMPEITGMVEVCVHGFRTYGHVCTVCEIDENQEENTIKRYTIAREQAEIAVDRADEKTKWHTP